MLWGPLFWAALLFNLTTTSGCVVDDATSPVGELTLPVHTVCGGSDVVEGIDVSKWQSTVDWSAVAADGIAFGFARVSDGLNTPDATFAANWSGMKQAGVIRGAYQFFRPSQDAVAQADLLIQALADAGGIEATDLPPVLDVETDSGLSPSAVSDKVAAWIGRIEEKLAREPIIYSGSYFWDDEVSSAAFASYPLWTAHYTNDACPYVPDVWQAWTFWQYTDTGAVRGVAGNVDRNRFNGDLVALRAFIASTVLTPPPPCVPTGPEICGDGVDNDCANGIDDGCQDPPCTASGAEICDGIDNDCRGGADDGDPGGGAFCLLAGQRGPCASGLTRCGAGSIACEAAYTPQSEQCNGIDDDCNGVVDDTTQGCEGACVPRPERCNGLDDDCNGIVDDGTTESGEVCFAGPSCIVGEIICHEGAPLCEARPQAEICDGIDNNCNGLIDDTPAGCAGAPVCEPLPERCNGLDDDCDGLPDEGNPEGGGACSLLVGEQAFAGVQRCISGQLVCRVPSASALKPPLAGGRLVGGCGLGGTAPFSKAPLGLILIGCVLIALSRRRSRPRAPRSTD